AARGGRGARAPQPERRGHTARIDSIMTMKRLASTAPPPAEPLIAPTGSPGLNSVIDVVNAAVAPFQEAPPPEQGAAGRVSQIVGGAMGVMGAPAEIIDTAFASLTAPLAAMFPA